MSGNIDYIFFDCMETLVDLVQLPDLRDYARWGYEGSGVERYWTDFEEFFEGYNAARKAISQKLPEYREYEMYERFRFICRGKLSGADDLVVESVAGKIYKNYWKTYMSKSYLRDDVKEVVPALSKRYNLGVVSNFMVAGGIEELLKLNGIYDCFRFVVTSINVGWRKPHPEIYKTALSKAGVKPANIIFVGDDYVNDHDGPIAMGMRPVYLDRFKRHRDMPDRIESLYELEDMLGKA